MTRKANHGELPRTGTVWLLFDLSNGHELTKRYVWWFDTKRQAREFKREQLKRKHRATLSAPMKATLAPRRP